MLTRLIQALRPAQDFPIAVRYATATALVLLCLSIRLLFPAELSGAPFLVFFPAVVVSALLFDSGTGIYAVILSTAIISWLSMRGQALSALPPRGLAAGAVVFLVVGVFVAMTLEALRRTVEALRAAQAEAKREHEILDRVFSQTPDPVVLMGKDLKCLRINDAGAGFLGVTREEAVGKTFYDFFAPAEAEIVEALTREIMRARQSVAVDVTLTPPSGNARTFLASSGPVFDADGEVFGVVSVAKDIEARKTLEDYKALLLLEINHRVKNDLHSIASFLDLSARRTDEPVAVEALQAGVRRIQVLARVYDMLRFTGRNPVVGAKDFIESLCSDLKSGFEGVKPVTFDVRVDDAEIENTRAVALGLIINELVTNALKYAFPGEREGRLEIGLVREGDDFKLHVADDGVGSSGDEQPGAGSRLVRLLVQQLGGTLERSGPPGTSFCVRFPIAQHVPAPAAPPETVSAPQPAP